MLELRLQAVLARELVLEPLALGVAVLFSLLGLLFPGDTELPGRFPLPFTGLLLATCQYFGSVALGWRLFLAESRDRSWAMEEEPPVLPVRLALEDSKMRLCRGRRPVKDSSRGNFGTGGWGSKFKVSCFAGFTMMDLLRDSLG